jgi:RNA polymerase sigma-70 factor, ECF subfamily
VVTAGDPTTTTEWRLTDPTAVLAFYRAHATEIYRYVSCLTGGDQARTEDLVQEVFVNLVSAVRGGRVETVTAGWLFTTARNLFLHQLRGNRRDTARMLRTAEGRASPPPGQDEVADMLVLRRAMEQLSDTDRAALMLRYFDDLPVREVALAIGRSDEATESLLARARRHLRIELKETDQ